MDINPLDGACFSIGANVVFIIFTFLPGGEETPFRGVCQIDLCGGNFWDPQITPTCRDGREHGGLTQILISSAKICAICG
jgi:hypothetical protein